MPVSIESTQANSDTSSVGNTAASLIGGIANAATGGVAGLVSTGISALGHAIFNKSQSEKDQEQLNQQGRLDAQQEQYNEEQSDYGEQLQQKLWNGTNSIALADDAAKEGYNPALIYGGGGGGGSTGSGITGVNAPAASTATEQTNADTQQQNANTQSEATQENIKSQEAGIEQTKQNTKLTAFQNMLNNTFGVQNAHWQNMINGVDAEKTNIQWEAFKTAAQNADGDGSVSDPNNPYVKALKAGMLEAEAQLKGEQENNKLLDAKTTVEQFKANLAKQGIDPDSPWYVNIIGDLLGKFGINPLSTTKKAITTVSGQ